MSAIATLTWKCDGETVVEETVVFEGSLGKIEHGVGVTILGERRDLDVIIEFDPPLNIPEAPCEP